MMRRPRIVVFVVLAPLILMSPALFGGRLIYYGTVALQFHPWRMLALDILRAGELPLWNIYSGMGAPLMANYQSALLYPPTWIELLLGLAGGGVWMAWGHGFVVFLHLVIASWGMVSLIRALGLGVVSQTVGGLAFGLSGYVVARSHFLSMNAAMAWLPWVMLLVYKVAVGLASERFSAFLGLVLVMVLQLLTGHAQLTWYTWLLGAAWLLFWLANGAAYSRDGVVGAENSVVGSIEKFRVVLLFFLAVILAVLITAIQLVPTAEFTLNSHRAAGADEIFVMTYSFWPWRLITMGLPGFFGSPAAEGYWGYANYWEDAVYIGLLPLLAAGQTIFYKWRGDRLSSLIRFLTVLVLLSFILAFGQNLPVFPFLYRYVPTFNLFQAPTRFTIWAVFSMSILAAIGVQHWSKHVSTYGRKRASIWLAVSMAVAIAGGVSRLILPDLNASIGNATVVAGITGAAVAVLLRVRNRNGVWQLLVVSLLSLELLIAGWGLNPGVDKSFYQSKILDRQFDNLAETGQRFYMPEADIYDLTFDYYFNFMRFEEDMIGLRDTHMPNLNLLDGLAAVNQFDPLQIRRYSALTEGVADLDQPKHSALLSELHVGLQGESEPVGNGQVKWNPIETQPRVEWFACAEQMSDAQSALSRFVEGSASGEYIFLESGHFLEAENCTEVNRSLSVGEIHVDELQNNQLKIQLEANQAGWVMIRDTYYPGWTAIINDEPAEVLPANGIFRAVRTPAGPSEIVLSYQPVSVKYGIYISMVGLLCFMGLVVHQKRG